MRGFQEDFVELEGKFRSMARQFESRQRSAGQPHDPETGDFISRDDDRFKPKERIGQGMSTAIKYDVVRDARRDATRYVPEMDAQKIFSEHPSWKTHRVYTTSELVVIHEYGTSTKAEDQSRATINSPDGRGYIIPRSGYDEISVGPDDFPQALERMPWNFRYVVHPGVGGKQFVRNAAFRHTDTINERVDDEFDKFHLDV